jgi:hypothetical protein
LVKKTRRPDPPYNPALEALRDELAEVAVSDAAQPIIDGIFARWAADHRVLIPRKICAVMLSVSATHEIDLERNGALCSILHSGQRLITADSLYRLMIADALESYPAGAEPKKARLPPSMHKPKPTFGHGGKRENTPHFPPKARPAKPDHVHERELAAAPSPAGEVKRGRPPGSRNRPKIDELSATPAD